MMTLDGMIGVLDAFTPEEGSAELEMVASGLAPRLSEVGPRKCCSPHHMLPCDSINKVSKCYAILVGRSDGDGA